MRPSTRDGGEVRSSYAEPGTLRSRAGLYQYRVGDASLATAVGQHLDVHPGDRYLDLGVGEGPYLDLALARDPQLMVGVDTSAAMLERARRRAGGLVAVRASLDALPFRPSRWDVILAAHSLYHADEPDRVIADIRGLLRPGGHLVLVLNGEGHLRELRLMAAAAGHPGLLGESARCTAEYALGLLERESQPSVTWLRDTLAVPDVGPIVAYVDSTRRMYEDRLGPGLSWEDMLDDLVAIARRASATVAGAVEIRTETAVIRCS